MIIHTVDAFVTYSTALVQLVCGTRELTRQSHRVVPQLGPRHTTRHCRHGSCVAALRLRTSIGIYSNATQISYSQKQRQF